MTCKAAGLTSEYQGQTGRNAYSRGLEHMKNLRTCLKHCSLVSHKKAQHPDSMPEFKMVILASFNSPLARQIEEAERIGTGANNPLTMNSRAEWGSTPIPQLAMTQGRVPPGSRQTLPSSSTQRQDPSQSAQAQAQPVQATQQSTQDNQQGLPVQPVRQPGLPQRTTRRQHPRQRPSI